MAHGLDAVETGQTAASLAKATDAASLPDRLFGTVNYIIVLISSTALVVAALVLTYSVVVRYFLKYSTDWQDETAVFLIVGAVFMSAAAIQARRGHVAIEAIVGLLPARVNRARILIVDFASLLFCGYFSWKAWLLLHEAVVDHHHSGSTWGPPLWIPYSLMAVGMTLLSVQILLQVVHELRGARAL